MHSVMELRDFYPPHLVEEQQLEWEFDDWMDTSASFAPYRLPVLSGSSAAQPPRATPAASAPRGGSSASHQRGDAPTVTHRRALSVKSHACGALVPLTSPRGQTRRVRIPPPPPPARAFQETPV
ncbi:unnamed protein product [Closterium sp. NIES-54]